MTVKPKILILSGYGLNCEDETRAAFELAEGQADIVHINDLVANKNKLMSCQILAIPGGFSYGDDTGSGKAYANKLKNHLQDVLYKFSDSHKLIIGICNGFQILTNLGLLPGALTYNTNNRYTDRWVDLRLESKSPWLKDISRLSLPIAHGEGQFYAPTPTLAIIKQQKQIAGQYTRGEICALQNSPANPNGSAMDIAMITSENGRILGTMPHPERAIFFNQLPHWTLLKEKLLRQGKTLPQYGPGIKIFKNAINFFG